MQKILISLAMSLLAAAPVAGSEKKDVMAVVRQLANIFNRTDSKLELATCADATSIIDAIPPHEWHGPGACSKWASDFDAFVKTDEITDIIGTVATPLHVDITADRAYVVVPMKFAYKQKGKDMKESSLFTVALQKGTAGWHIAGWASAAH